MISTTICQLMSQCELARAFPKVTTDIVSVKRIARGDVSVTTKSVEAAQNLMQVTELGDHYVTTHEPESLMRSRGVIYGIDLDVEKQPPIAAPSAWSDLTFVYDEPVHVKSTANP